MAEMAADVSRALAVFIARTGVGREASRDLAARYAPASSIGDLPAWITEDPDQARRARIDMVLDGPVEVLDEMSRALVDALDEIFRLRHVRTTAGAKKYGLPIGSVIGGGSSPGLHVPGHAPTIGHGRPAVAPAPAPAIPKAVAKATPRTPRTSAKERLVASIDSHLKGNGQGDPFEGFNREQLRQVAKERGVGLDRGEGRESIAKKLLDHARGGHAEPAKSPPAARDASNFTDADKLAAATKMYGSDESRWPRSIQAEAAKIRARQLKRPAAKKAEPKPTTTPPHGRSSDSPALRRLADTVERGSVKQETALAGGVAGDTRKRVYADGTQTVWKQSKPFRDLDAKHQADAEELAPLVAHALGLNAPAVHRGDERTVHMEFVDDATVDWDFPVFNNEQPRSDQGRMLGLLDLLINNPDRHRGNIMVKNSDGSIIPIDHGLAWSMLDTIEPARPSRDVRNPYMDHFFSSFHEQWTDNDLTPADMAEVRKRLQPLKADFARIGRTEWFDFMNARLDVIAEHAKGTTSRLGSEVA